MKSDIGSLHQALEMAAADDRPIGILVYLKSPMGVMSCAGLLDAWLSGGSHWPGPEWRRTWPQLGRRTTPGSSARSPTVLALSFL